jgi:hypothetical protein
MDIRKIDAILNARKLLSQLDNVEKKKRDEAQYQRNRNTIINRRNYGEISSEEAEEQLAQNENGKWNPALHPRDASGKFTSGAGTSAAKPAAKPAAPAKPALADHMHPGGKEGAQRDADKLRDQWRMNSSGGGLPKGIASKLSMYDPKSGHAILDATAIDPSAISMRIQYYDLLGKKRVQNTMVYWSNKKNRWEP